jgi:amino acid permease
VRDSGGGGGLVVLLLALVLQFKFQLELGTLLSASERVFIFFATSTSFLSTKCFQRRRNRSNERRTTNKKDEQSSTILLSFGFCSFSYHQLVIRSSNSY